ncbi:MAG TPA: GNAT family N-acetyltransferase [Candidatus Limnocylindria bacterium]
MTLTLDLAEAPDVEGLRFRNYTGVEDLPGMLAVWNAVHATDGLEEIQALDDMQRAYSTLVNCDPGRDIVLAEVHGEIVAYARVLWLDLVEGGRAYELFGFVHPTWRRRGIGRALLVHNESRLREIAADHADASPKLFNSEGVEADAGNGALMRAAGYEAVRYWYDMVAPSLDALTPTAMPDGLEVRPVTRDQYRALWDASAEAFRDEWGQAEWAEQDWERFQANPQNADPRYWRIGWEGDQVAGVITTTVPTEENEEYGRRRVYVSAVSVRRPWRRRGLARALLSSSLVAAREEGFTSASLGVDSTSPTGAIDLYRSLGFAPEKTFITWRKPL